MGSVIAGGDFWRGAQQGVIVTVYNHAVHGIAKNFSQTKGPGDEEQQQEQQQKKIKIPSPEKIKKAYVNKQDICSKARLECAVRMSETLQKLGVDISGSNEQRTIHVENGMVHQMGARPLAQWLWKRTELGAPKEMKSSRPLILSDFKGKSGIMYFVHPENGGSGPGHIDVIYKGQMGSGFYDNKQIWFWEYKNGSYVKNRN